MDKFIYISPSENEERIINVSELREVYRIKDVIGYSFKTDGGDTWSSTAKMASEEEAIAAFRAINL